jgi:Tfp pilus assembly protein PilN
MLLQGMWQYQTLQAELDDLQMQSVPARTPKAEKPHLSKQDQEVLALRARDANDVLNELGTDWNGLLDGLEKAAMPGISLLEIKPEASKGSLSIKGEARRLPDILEYARQLETIASFDDVALQEHEVAKEDAQKPVRFVIDARWRKRP